PLHLLEEGRIRRSLRLPGSGLRCDHGGGLSLVPCPGGLCAPEGCELAKRVRVFGIRGRVPLKNGDRRGGLAGGLESVRVGDLSARIIRALRSIVLQRIEVLGAARAREDVAQDGADARPADARSDAEGDEADAERDREEEEDPFRLAAKLGEEHQVFDARRTTLRARARCLAALCLRSCHRVNSPWASGGGRLCTLRDCGGYREKHGPPLP